MISDVYRAMNMSPTDAQLALAKLCVGETLNPKELETFKLCAPDQAYGGHYDEITAICGRKVRPWSLFFTQVCCKFSMHLSRLIDSPLDLPGFRFCLVFGF